MAGTTEASWNDATSWKTQGNINYKQGHYKDALLFYEKGLLIDPDNIDIWNNRGMALVKLGRIDEARQCQLEIKRLKEKSGVTHNLSPTVSPEGLEKPGQCTIKIKGVEENNEIPKNGQVPVTPGFTEKNLEGKLQIRDIEQNIELIQSGLEQVRLGRIKEAKQCKLQIKEMEKSIELTKQGLNLVKKGRIEEARKIKQVEECIELTMKGLELIKLGRMEEAKHYKQQLMVIEEHIGLTRKGLNQVKPEGAPTDTGGNPGVKARAENTQEPGNVTAPVMPVAVGWGMERTDKIKDIEDIIGLPHEVDQPVIPNKIIIASVLCIFFAIVILCYFAYFR